MLFDIALPRDTLGQFAYTSSLINLSYLSFAGLIFNFLFLLWIFLTFIRHKAINTKWILSYKIFVGIEYIGIVNYFYDAKFKSIPKY